VSNSFDGTFFRWIYLQPAGSVFSLVKVMSKNIRCFGRQMLRFGSKWWFLNDSFIRQRFTLLLFLRFDILTRSSNGILSVKNFSFCKRVTNTILIRVFHTFRIQVYHLVIAKLVRRWRICLTHHFHLYLATFGQLLNIRYWRLRLLNIQLLLKWRKFFKIRRFIGN